MIANLFTRTALHQHADPEQRILGVAALPADSEELARLLEADPAPEVRIAAARRCNALEALARAWGAEADATVRLELGAAFGEALGRAPNRALAQQLLASERCADAVRIEAARRSEDATLRRAAIDAIRDEDALVQLATLAELAETRLAAAQRVGSPDALRKLVDAAKNRDHGVARHARQRLDAIKQREEQEKEAEAIIAQLEALAAEPGAILSAVIELNRRWQALDLGARDQRLARCDAARQAIQARFEREQNEQRARAQLERGLADWIGRLDAAPATPEALAAARDELAALREEARACADAAALTRLDEAEARVARREAEVAALAEARALVVEAERLAADTSIDDAQLPARWQALDRAIRTADLTRRFEAALTAVEQRRLAQVQATQQEAGAARRQVHALLHAAEQALAAGQLQTARAAAEEIKTLRAAAGTLPKPSTQRLARMQQQLVELERWQSFGQQNARIQLCERAEAAASLALDAAQLALEVQKLRAEWKALDQQHAGVPKALWQRFDGACEKAYAPAARHFAEVAARRKEARKRREEYIAAAAAHAPTLLAEPVDWRALERWMRDTEHAWREGELGSVDAAAWKKLDQRFKAALTPLRETLSNAREQAKAGRRALIGEVAALLPKANERDIPAQVKAIQARWQAEAKAVSLAQRDERALWEQFRRACDTVFEARQSQRKQADERKNEQRQGLQELCVQLEQLAQATNLDEPALRRALRELQEQWKERTRASAPELRELQARFARAGTAVEEAIAGRARSRDAALWQTLAAKERLCEELDALLLAAADTAQAEAQCASVRERWQPLPELPAAWEQKLLARRDAALAALCGGGEGAALRVRIEQGAAARREGLLELELLLGMESPAEFQPQRLALQVKQLKQRFSSGASAAAPSARDRLLAWCGADGVADALDRERCARIFARLERSR